MSIVVKLEDSRGTMLARLIPAPRVHPFANLFGRQDLPMLQWVDPYSDTVFSAYQMRGLIPELEVLARTCDGEDADFVQQVLPLAERCMSEPHHRLVFRGD